MARCDRWFLTAAQLNGGTDLDQKEDGLRMESEGRERRNEGKVRTSEGARPCWCFSRVGEGGKAQLGHIDFGPLGNRGVERIDGKAGNLALRAVARILGINRTVVRNLTGKRPWNEPNQVAREQRCQNAGFDATRHSIQPKFEVPLPITPIAPEIVNRSGPFR